MDDEKQEKAESFAAETLSGDVRDVVLTHIKALKKPWAKMSEADQVGTIDAIERMAEDIVRRAVSIIARRGFDCIPIKIADFTVKGGAIKGKFEAIVTESNVVSLADHQAHSAVMVLTDMSDFMGEKGEAKADPDEPNLPLDGKLDDGDMKPIADAMPNIPQPELEDA